MKISPRSIAVTEAVFVTILWSSSWVLIKFGLTNIPALTFAGIRYFLAAIILTPFLLHRNNFQILKSIDKKDLIKILLLGFCFYAVTQGAQFLGLYFLEAVTVSLLFNFTSILVAVLSYFYLKEKPRLHQWAGTFIFVIGVIIYFFPLNIISSSTIGIIIVIIGVFANAISSILGRELNRKNTIKPVIITILSMSFGSIILLAAGLTLEEFPKFEESSIIIIIWLAIVNTALAFTLWNHSLKILGALESSIINNSMLIQISLLAIIFLDEKINLLEGLGLVTAFIGIILVNLREIKFSKIRRK